MLFAFFLIIWLMGSRRKITFWRTYAPMIGLWMFTVTVTILSPEDSLIRLLLGQDLRLLLIFGGLGALVIGYGHLIGYLHRRASAKGPDAPIGLFANAELARHSRHILLREIGGAGQARLKGARVLVIGAGGLGSPALMYLAAAGVGTIGVIDDDLVEDSNLGRQTIHMAVTVGLPKVQSAKETLNAQNPYCRVLPYHRRMEDATKGLIAEYDLILDGSDNMATRYLVNAACVAAGKPLISAALTQWEGQISLYHPPRAPCYACIFPDAPAAGLAPACAEGGVLSPLPGVIGAMMAVEAVKQITGAGETLAGRMLIYDALDGRSQSIALTRNPACPVCGHLG